MNELKIETWNELKAFVDGLITENEILRMENSKLKNLANISEVEDEKKLKRTCD